MSKIIPTDERWIGEVYENNGEFFCLSQEMADFRYSEKVKRLLTFFMRHDVTTEAKERVGEKITDIYLIPTDSGERIDGCIIHDWIVHPIDQPRRWEKIDIVVQRYGYSLLSAFNKGIVSA